MTEVKPPSELINVIESEKKIALRTNLCASLREESAPFRYSKPNDSLEVDSNNKKPNRIRPPPLTSFKNFYKQEYDKLEKEK